MISFPISDVTFRIFPFIPIDARMYLLTTERDALLVDPSVNTTAVEFLRKNSVKHITIILTHEHYDHISGVNYFRDQFNCSVYCTKICAESIGNPRKNLSRYFESLFCEQPEAIQQLVRSLNIQPYSCTADYWFSEDTTNIFWAGHSIKLIATPGHSPGSLCIMLDDKVLFTGDSMLGDGGTVTRLPGGNQPLFKQKTFEFLKTLNAELLVLPGHGEPGRLGDLFHRFYFK